MDENKQKRYGEVKEVGMEITRLVGECQKLFQAVEDSCYWQAYLEFVDEIIVAGRLFLFDQILFT